MKNSDTKNSSIPSRCRFAEGKISQSGILSIRKGSKTFDGITYKIGIAILFISLFMGFPFFVLSQPANDDICNAAKLTVNADFPTNGTNISATTVSTDNVGTCWLGGTKSNTVWYYFTAPASGNVTVTTDHSGYSLTDTQLAIFSSSDNTCSGTLLEVGCDDNGGTENPYAAMVILTGLTAGKPYFVEVDGYSNTTGTFGIDVHDGGDILVNDDCADAMTLYVGSSCILLPQCTFTSFPNSVNTIATSEAWETAPQSWTQGTTLNTVWYKFTAVNTSTNIQIESVTGGSDPHVGVYSGTCDSLTLIASQEDKGGGGAAGKGVNLTFSTTVGQTYYVQYDSDLGTGTNRICVNSTDGMAPASNDNYTSAIALTINNTITSNNFRATADGSFSCGTTENNVWYKYTPASSGVYYFSLSCLMDCYNLNNSACMHTGFFCASMQMTLYNNGANPPSSSNETGCVSSENCHDIVITATLTAGTTYLLSVDGMGGAIATFTVNTSQSNPLPVSLLAFTGNSLGRSNVLKWVTASETNNDYYTVEHSADAMTFEAIGTIKGAGNSNSALTYTFADNSPFNNVNYYRLKQTDFDGKTEYPGSVIAIDNSDQPVVNEMIVYPNPNSGSEISVLVGSNNSREASVKITDVMGRVIYVDKIKIDAETNNAISIKPDSKLNPGIYFISVSNDEIDFNKSFIVQ